MPKVSFIPPNGTVVTPSGNIYTEYDGRLYAGTVGSNTPPCTCDDEQQDRQAASQFLRRVFDDGTKPYEVRISAATALLRSGQEV